MLVFRSFAIGLLAACFALLVTRPTVELRVAPDPEPAPEPRPALPAPPAPPTIIDAAAGITPAQLASTLHLSHGERIVSIDDASVAGDLGAGIALAARELRAREFVDIGVLGPAGARRILVLVH
jgi:hypothetical protein